VGWYPSEVVEATEKLSSNGNMMFETKFKVFADNGSFRLLTSYIMATGKAAFQLRSFAEGFDL